VILAGHLLVVTVLAMVALVPPSIALLIGALLRPDDERPKKTRPGERP
jgi:hypothetical protein